MDKEKKKILIAGFASTQLIQFENSNFPHISLVFFFFLQLNATATGLQIEWNAIFENCVIWFSKVAPVSMQRVNAPSVIS